MCKLKKVIILVVMAKSDVEEICVVIWCNSNVSLANLLKSVIDVLFDMYPINDKNVSYVPIREKQLTCRRCAAGGG